MTASPLESWSALEVTNLTATLKMPSEVAEQFRSNAISGRGEPHGGGAAGEAVLGVIDT